MSYGIDFQLEYGELLQFLFFTFKAIDFDKFGG